MLDLTRGNGAEQFQGPDALIQGQWRRLGLISPHGAATGCKGAAHDLLVREDCVFTPQFDDCVIGGEIERLTRCGQYSDDLYGHSLGSGRFPITPGTHGYIRPLCPGQECEERTTRVFGHIQPDAGVASDLGDPQCKTDRLGLVDQHQRTESVVPFPGRRPAVSSPRRPLQLHGPAGLGADSEVVVARATDLQPGNVEPVSQHEAGHMLAGRHSGHGLPRSPGPRRLGDRPLAVEVAVWMIG